MILANKMTLERILDNKASSWAGVAAMMPLLLAIIFLGTITYKVGKQTAPIIEKMLTPPKVQPQEQINFDDVDAPFKNQYQTSFEEFEENEVVLFEVPNVTEDIPEIEPVRVPVDTEVAMSETPDNQPVVQVDKPAADVPGAIGNDPSVQTITRDDNQGLDATLRSAGGTGPAQPTNAEAASDQPGGAALGKDKSGDITATEGVEQAVVINRSERIAGQGVGLSKPASKEKQDLTGWILGHPRALPLAVAEALDFSVLKADRTSTGSVVDETGKLYEFYFLHRIQNNLLRILVVLGNQAYRIDLPDFYLEANHVKAGRVFRGPPPEDDPFAPGQVIEVALESVSEIPAEVPDMFQLVLDWLEIKGQE